MLFDAVGKLSSTWKLFYLKVKKKNNTNDNHPQREYPVDTTLENLLKIECNRRFALKK